MLGGARANQVVQEWISSPGEAVLLHALSTEIVGRRLRRQSLFGRPSINGRKARPEPSFVAKSESSLNGSASRRPSLTGKTDLSETTSTPSTSCAGNRDLTGLGEILRASSTGIVDIPRKTTPPVGPFAPIRNTPQRNDTVWRSLFLRSPRTGLDSCISSSDEVHDTRMNEPS